MYARKRLLLVVSILLLSVLSCTIYLGGPEYPEQSIPVSTEAVGQLEAGIQTAVVAGVESGKVTLIITEPQLTSYLAYKLQAQTQPFISDPQVYLRDGQIQIYGTAHQGYFEATASIILTPQIDEQGRIQLEITSADFGPLPIPEGLKEAITAIVSEAYTGSLGPVATGFRLEAIVIADGAMLLIGRIR